MPENELEWAQNAVRMGWSKSHIINEAKQWFTDTGVIRIPCFVDGAAFAREVAS